MCSWQDQSNIPDDQILISETEDGALLNSEIYADSVFTVEVATSKMVTTNERDVIAGDRFFECDRSHHRTYAPFWNSPNCFNEIVWSDKILSYYHELLSFKKVTHCAISEELEGVQASFLDQISGKSQQLEIIDHPDFGKEPIAKNNLITLSYLKVNVSLQPHVKMRGCPK